MLHRLGPRGMSSDESDHQPDGGVRYRILRKHWRNPALTAWLRIFDYLYRSSHLALSDDIPSRFATGKVSFNGPPVRGLPRNAYNEAWLDTLSAGEVQRLGARQEETYSFTHSPELDAQFSLSAVP